VRKSGSAIIAHAKTTTQNNTIVKAIENTNTKLRDRILVCGGSGSVMHNVRAEATIQNSTATSTDNAQRKAIEITKTKAEHKIQIANGFTKILHRTE